MGVAAHRWRLKAATERLAGAVGPGYFAALAGAAPGAWLSGSLNTMQGTTAFLSHSIAAAVVRAGARGRYFNTVDLVNRLQEESRLGKAGALASQLGRLDLVVLDELGYLPFARSG